MITTSYGNQQIVFGQLIIINEYRNRWSNAHLEGLQRLLDACRPKHDYKRNKKVLCLSPSKKKNHQTTIFLIPYYVMIGIIFPKLIPYCCLKQKIAATFSKLIFASFQNAILCRYFSAHKNSKVGRDSCCVLSRGSRLYHLWTITLCVPQYNAGANAVIKNNAARSVGVCIYLLSGAVFQRYDPKRD